MLHHGRHVQNSHCYYKRPLSHQSSIVNSLSNHSLVLPLFSVGRLLIEGVLERSLSDKGQGNNSEVQCTEEANFCDLVFTQAARLLGNKEVVLVDVKTEALVCPVNTLIIIIPIHAGDLSNTFIP